MGSFTADFRFRAEGKKVTSRAKLKILQLKLWLEPARLGLITYLPTYLLAPPPCFSDLPPSLSRGDHLQRPKNCGVFLLCHSGPCPKKVGIILMTIHAWFHEPLHLIRNIFDLFTSDIVSESNLLTIFKLLSN